MCGVDNSPGIIISWASTRVPEYTRRTVNHEKMESEDTVERKRVGISEKPCLVIHPSGSIIIKSTSKIVR